jgi:predicted phage tail protein
VYTNTPTFKWQNNANTHSYELQVDDNKDFTSPVYDNSTFFSSETPPGFAQGKYYWRVRAFNIYNTAGPWSDTRQFTISIPPGIPILYSPGNYSTIYANPTFSWSSVANASGYQIQIFFRANNSLFLDSSTASTQFIPPQYPPDGYYYWRVRAINEYGTPGPWTSIWFFHLIIVH